MTPHRAPAPAGRPAPGSLHRISGDDLDSRSSKELHDLAVGHALRHLDVGFLLRLMQALPVAETAAGETDAAQADAFTLRAHIDDLSDSGQGEVAELLRPLYLDYLRSHGVTSP